MRNSKPILLVDDDRVDAMALERALKDVKVTNQLVHAIDGKDALQYLRSEGNEKPCIIFLDSNMPKMNSIEFLRIIKADEVLKKIPVVALTTSKNEEDVVQAFELSVAGYIIKVAEYKKFEEIVRTIDLYWTLSELPNGS
ncbi:MAG: response regulator [Phycisphaerae bacterium]